MSMLLQGHGADLTGHLPLCIALAAAFWGMLAATGGDSDSSTSDACDADARSLPKLSVVMATYNRAETLKLTLGHLAQQSLPKSDYEVVLVDDGSTDHTEQIVAGLGNSLGFRLTYLRHPNRGPGYTQNRGILGARAPLVLLMADDILMTSGALAAHVRAHEAHPQEEAAVLGKVLQAPCVDGSLFLRKWDPFKFRDLAGLKELPYFLFWACNVSFKRDFMLTRGMFRDERGSAGAAAHEDVELGYRLSRHGLRLLYREDALGYHHHLEDLDGACRRAYQRGLNWSEFRKLVDDPQISVRYHVFNRRTWRDYRGAFYRENPQLGADRRAWLLLGRIALRSLLFNRLAVMHLWMPLARLAERSKIASLLMHRQLYRGIISHHFFKGVGDRDAQSRDGKGKEYGVPQR